MAAKIPLKGYTVTVSDDTGRIKTVIPVSGRFAPGAELRTVHRKTKRVSKAKAKARARATTSAAVIEATAANNSVSANNIIAIIRDAFDKRLTLALADWSKGVAPLTDEEEAAMLVGGERQPRGPVVLSAEESRTLAKLVVPEREPVMTPEMLESVAHYKRIMGEMLPDAPDTGD